MTETIKVKPWGAGQGDHVLINKDDFDAEKHEHFEAADSVSADANGDGKLTVPELRAALTAKQIPFPEGAKKAELKALLDAAQ